MGDEQDLDYTSGQDEVFEGALEEFKGFKKDQDVPEPKQESEKLVETKEEPAKQPEAKPEQSMVPLPALHQSREENRRLREELEALKKPADKQPEQPAKPTVSADALFEDPTALDKYINDAVEQRIKTQRETERAERLNTQIEKAYHEDPEGFDAVFGAVQQSPFLQGRIKGSERADLEIQKIKKAWESFGVAQEKHADIWADVIGIIDADLALSAKVLDAANPGEEAVRLYKIVKLRSEMEAAPDPDEWFRQRIAAQSQQPAQTAETVTQQPKPAVKMPPKSLASAPGTSGAGRPPVPESSVDFAFPKEN